MKDTIICYNGILSNQTTLNNIAYDESIVRKIITDNQEKYKDSLKVILKLTDKATQLDQAEKILSIVKESHIEVTGWSLTTADKAFFKVNDFKWQVDPVEIFNPDSVK